MDTRKQLRPLPSLPLMQEDIVAARRLIEPIGRRLGINGQELDDVVQVCLIVAMEKCNEQKYDSAEYRSESFSSPQIAWIVMFACGCVKRTVLNRRKHASRYNDVLRHMAESITPDCIGVSPPTQIDDIRFHEEAACVQRQLSDEENRMRELLEDGLNVEEISAQLNISKGACYKRKNRLQEKVASILDGETPPAEPDSG